jgi:diadenosine tetraphosphate (Ap4A) HIT family hydrolase
MVAVLAWADTDPVSLTPCPFCVNEPLERGELVAVHLDKYPVSPGHLLITPLRHVSSLWDLTEQEYTELFVTARRLALADRSAPSAWNIGVNVGAAAGQTVMHVHLHLIPRQVGDVDDPRGGIRWVVPARAVYWER